MRVIAVLVFLTMATAVGAGESLSVRFIGNEAFEISDGETTLLTDFPYLSGAYGYMSYDDEELRPRENALCLFTHRHGDHFAPEKLEKIGCTVAGPEEVTGKVKTVPVLELGDELEFGGIVIRPVRSPHGDVEHYSYIVKWHGVKMFFAGDTTDAAVIGYQGRIDVLFISPWIMRNMTRARIPMGTKKTVIYHHRDGEKVEDCDECHVPEQGGTFEILLPEE